MKREGKKEPSNLNKMWHDKRGKAILKLWIWFAFFCIMGLLLVMMSIFNKPTNKPNISKNPVTNPIVNYLSLNEMWDKLFQDGYDYKYQITNKETNETTLYQGSKKEEIDTGYRESKIGIIKYRIEQGHIYQILVDTEEEITSIYEEGEDAYLNLRTLRSNLNNIIPEERKSGTMREIVYQNDDVTTTIHTTTNEITSIRITTPFKEYNLLLEGKTKEE